MVSLRCEATPWTLAAGNRAFSMEIEEQVIVAVLWWWEGGGTYLQIHVRLLSWSIHTLPPLVFSM